LKKIFYLFLLSAAICSQGFSQNKFTDSLQRQLPLSKDDTTRVLIMAELSFYYRYINIDSAIHFGEQALSLSEHIHYLRGEANALTHIGQAMREKGDLPKALELQIRARNIAKENNYTTEYATALRRIGLVYMDLRDYPKTLSYLHQALYQAERIQSKRGMTIEYMNLGMTHEYMKDLDSAFYYVQKAFDGKEYIEDLYPEVLRVMGNIQSKKDNQSLAMNYYRQGIEAGLKLNDYRTISYICSDAAAMFKYFNQPDSSIAYAKKGLEYGKINSYKKSILFSSTILSEYYDSIDAKQALYYYKIAAAAKDSLFGAGNMQTIQSLVSKEEARQKEIEQAKAAYQNKLKLFGLLAGLLVFSIIAFIQFRNNRQKQKANKVLEDTLANLKSAQSQLIQSEKMASLGELTAGIAHEIQNPLNFVNNFSELSNELITEMNEELDNGNTDEVKAIASDIMQNLEKIHHHGKRADSIVKGMLQHSQKGSGQREPTDINALAEEYLHLAYHGYIAKNNTLNASLVTGFDKDIGNINLVQQDISRVLLNLYNNAFYALSAKALAKADGDYQPTITLTTKRKAEFIEITVKDNGLGIPEKIREKIFQPFFTTKPTGQGTGLGLSMSYDTIKAHGGELKVDTKDGEGASFIILLPVKFTS
jgi:signal transduction histidine kinase